MEPNQIVKWGAGIWLFVVLVSAIHAYLHEPAPGFLSGLENVLIFLAWQAGALLVALAVFIVRLVTADRISGAARWQGILPFVLSGGFALFIAVWLAFAE